VGSTNVNAKLSAYAYQPAILSYAIYVNKAGNRYTNEMGSTVAADTYTQPSTAAFMIFDSTPANLNVVMHVSAGHNNFKEWLADGVLTQSNTLAALATTLGIDPTGLAAMVTKWNGYVAAKNDPDFKRTTFVSPISVAPFYGIQATLFSLELANGTLMTDIPTLKVLDEAGKVIPRLYAAGDNGRAGVMGGGHGTHMAWTFISGRIAGTNAAAETPLP
jgi:fumarate reductase flavoprotein subunit